MGPLAIRRLDKRATKKFVGFIVVDHVWSVPTRNLTAEILATGILMIALSAASTRRFLDGSGGGTPAFERLIAGGAGEWPSTDDLLAMGAEFLDQ